MTAHTVVTQVVNASAADVFDLIHDYPRRLEWDTLLRRAVVLGGGQPGPDVQTACSAKWHLGGLTFQTRYVTFRPGELAAVTLARPVFLFSMWAASIRHRDLPDGRSDVTYTLTFRCRPRALSGPVEWVALRAFRFETGRRLRALALFMAEHTTTASDRTST